MDWALSELAEVETLQTRLDFLTAQRSPPGNGPKPAQPVQLALADDEPSVVRERWYGWQSLATDGAALLLLIAAGAASDQKNDSAAVLGYSALGLYLLGGPVTHFARDRPGRGLGSLGFAPAPPSRLEVGSKLEDCSGDNDHDLCGFGGAIRVGALDARE